MESFLTFKYQFIKFLSRRVHLEMSANNFAATVSMSGISVKVIVADTVLIHCTAMVTSDEPNCCFSVSPDSHVGSNKANNSREKYRHAVRNVLIVNVELYCHSFSSKS